MIIESERSGRIISDICIAFGVSRQTWYKWKRRYNTSGLDGLKNQSRRPHTIKNVKVTKELEKIILELRLRAYPKIIFLYMIMQQENLELIQDNSQPSFHIE